MKNYLQDNLSRVISPKMFSGFISSFLLSLTRLLFWSFLKSCWQFYLLSDFFLRWSSSLPFSPLLLLEFSKTLNKCHWSSYQKKNTLSFNMILNLHSENCMLSRVWHHVPGTQESGDHSQFCFLLIELANFSIPNLLPLCFLIE